MLEQIKLIVSDLDGTLLNNKKQPDSKIKKNIQKLKEKGIIFTVASGRNMPIVEPICQELGIEVPYITNGGSELVSNGEFLMRLSIDSQDLREISMILEEYQIRSVYYTSETLYTRYADEVSAYFLERMKNRVDVYPTEDLVSIINQKIYKIVIIEPDEDKLNLISGKINALSNTHCLKAENNLCTITHKKASKGEMISKLADYFQVTLNQVLVFGDNPNDWSMMQVAGASVAMGNADEETKKLATYVTLSNEEDGVSDFIQKNIV